MGLFLSFFYVRGKFNPGLWEEDEREDPRGTKGVNPPTYVYVMESTRNLLLDMGIPAPDEPPPTITSGTHFTF